MLNRLLRPAHEHPEAARRAAAVPTLPPDSPDLARLLASDPAPEVRAAAARRCTDLAVLARAMGDETDAQVRDALAATLGDVLSTGANADAARAFLAADACSDALRAEVARRATDPARWRAAIAAIQAQATLAEVALSAPHAQQRLAAAERVTAEDALRTLAEGARDKDRGVARIAKQRLDSLQQRAAHDSEADALLAQLDALVEQPGPVVTTAVELERRWRGLDLRADDTRRDRWDAANRRLQTRFEREHDEQRRRAQFERELRAALAEVAPAPTAEARAAVRARLEALDAQAQALNLPAASGELAQALQQLAERDTQADVPPSPPAADAAPTPLDPAALAVAIASAEALVERAERLALRLVSPPEAPAPQTAAAAPAHPAAGGAGTVTDATADAAATASPTVAEPATTVAAAPADVEIAVSDARREVASAEFEAGAADGDALPEATASADALSDANAPGLVAGAADDSEDRDATMSVDAPAAQSVRTEDAGAEAGAEVGAEVGAEAGERAGARAGARAGEQAREAVARDAGASTSSAAEDAAAPTAGETPEAATAEAAAPTATETTTEPAPAARPERAPKPPRQDRTPKPPQPPREHLTLFADWQALPAAARTPELAARFDAARKAIEEVVGAQDAALQAQQSAARTRLHALLHEGEQALAAGHLHAARAAVDAMKPLKLLTGPLPKPTQQRLGRLGQQLGELERWESFGQKTARVQLAERAEALAIAVTDAVSAEGAKPDVAKVAREVQALRAEWKALDKQHAGVPRSLWERFDKACEAAYAPAGRHFAEQAAQRKEARGKRDAFIDAAAAHAPTLVTAPEGAAADWQPDWRAIERWLRETDNGWRTGDLGSVDPREWKKLDGKLKAALAPARDALNAARAAATAARQALIDEVTALGERAMERDTVNKVRDAQVRWQQQAKAMHIAPRDERTLWTRFRSACDAVFQARDARRKEEDTRRKGSRGVLEQICEQVEHLATTAATDEAAARKSLKELQQQFRDAAAQERGLVRSSMPNTRAPERGRPGPRTNVADLEGRLKAAVRIVEAALGEQTTRRERATWQMVLDKERLCEELDRAILDGKVYDEAARAALLERWAALPNVGNAAEKRLAARRDAAFAAMDDETAAEKHGWTIEDEAEARAELLLDLEMHLGLPTPPELQQQRLALQVKQLRDRFKTSGPSTGNAAGDKLLAWCEKPGVANDKDRMRIERVVGRIR